MNGPYVSVASDAEPRRFDLPPGAVFRIGRSADNDLVLADEGASREHAVVRRDAAGCILVDAGSRNGTLLNGRPATIPTRLADGDVIEIGRTRLRYADPGAMLAAAATPAGGAAATLFLPQQSLISVLVLDIRGFTPLSAELGEQRISAMMSVIFQEAGAILNETRCWSQKYIGDAIMGVWRHAQDRLAREELLGLLTTLGRLHDLFGGMQARFDLSRPLVFGAALNTGPAAIGNMGSGGNADFTALGDTVNKAFRLETASKAYAVDLVIGETAFLSLSPPLDLGLLPPQRDVELKGYAAPQPARLFLFSDLPRLSALMRG